MATKTQSDKIKEAADGAIEEIKKYAPLADKYATLDPANKKLLYELAAATARETVTLDEEFCAKATTRENLPAMLDKEFSGQPKKIAQRLAKHLPSDRMKLLEGGLHIPTFRMKIIRKDDSKYWVEFTRDGQEFFPTRPLLTTEDVDWATIQQYSSMLIEAILLVMSAIGIALSPSANVIRKTVDETADAIKNSSKMQRALETFVKAWSGAGSNPIKMATALFYLMKDTYSAGILMTIIESLCSNMSWFDWLKTAAKVTAMLIAAFASGGAALIAEIALVVLKAVDFATKILNIVGLSDIKKEM